MASFALRWQNLPDAAYKFAYFAFIFIRILTACMHVCASQIMPIGMCDDLITNTMLYAYIYKCIINKIIKYLIIDAYEIDFI